MWQTFQGALERKVKLTGRGIGKKKQRIDKYVIEKAFREVLLEQFGEIGLSSVNLEIKDQNNVRAKCRSSVWKSELRMKKMSLMKMINDKIGDKIIKNIIIA